MCYLHRAHVASRILPRLLRMHPEHRNRAARFIARDAAAIAWIALSPLLCAQAQAQSEPHSIQKCRIDGRIVFQASPCPLEARPAASAPKATATSRPKAAADEASGPPKKRVLADLLREREAAERGPPAATENHGDGEKVLRARMGAL